MLKLIENIGNNKNGSMLIEAENLEALNELLPEYRGSIDTIIIDPPYNTNIDYIDYKDSMFPNGWPIFIQKRLELAKEMMSDRGSMFICIDENELVSLLNVCYSLFGKENVNILVWPKIDERYDANRVEKPIVNIKSAHEYIVLCYRDKKNTHFGMMGDGKLMESIVSGLGTTSSAKDEIAELLGSRTAFSTPKPMNLFKELVRISSTSESTVLDFFAGSCTTGHAVLDLNEEDGGNRRFIMITNNESNICRDVSNVRLKKAIQTNKYHGGYRYYLCGND